MRRLIVAAMVLLVILPPARAQSQMDGVQVLKKMSETYKNVKTYYLEGKVLMDIKGGPMPIKLDMPMVMAGAEQGKKKLEMTNPAFSVLIVSDGETTSTYIPLLKQYTRRASAPVKHATEKVDKKGSPIDQMFSGAALSDPISVYAQMADLVKEPRIVREEQLEVNGKKVDTYVIEYKIDPPPAHPNVHPLPRHVWIDKSSFLVLKETGVTKMDPVPPSKTPTELHTTFTVSVIRLNEPVSDALFAFAPPEGAKEVEELHAPGMNTTSVNLTGNKAADFTLKDLSDKPVNLGGLKGKVVLLDFWASWCKPCLVSMPHIEKLHREFKNKGLAVISINIEDAETARKFINKNRYTITTVVDGEGGVANSYKVDAIPTLFLIDREGKIALHHVGALGEAELRRALKKAGIE